MHPWPAIERNSQIRRARSVSIHPKLGWYWFSMTWAASVYSGGDLLAVPSTYLPSPLDEAFQAVPRVELVYY